jgi:hypothetical protein
MAPKTSQRRWLKAGLALLAFATAAHAAPVEELVVIVHLSSEVRKLDAAELEAIFTSARRSWPDGGRVVAFSYPPEDPLRVAFDQAVLRMSPDEVSRFWVDQRIRADRRPPRQAPDAALALRLVAKLAGSIAYVPSALVGNDVRVVARIRRGAVVEP